MLKRGPDADYDIDKANHVAGLEALLANDGGHSGV